MLVLIWSLKMIKFDAVDYFQPSVIKVGGVTEMLKVLKLSEKIILNLCLIQLTLVLGFWHLYMLHR